MRGASRASLAEAKERLAARCRRGGQASAARRRAVRASPALLDARAGAAPRAVRPGPRRRRPGRTWLASLLGGQGRRRPRWSWSRPGQRALVGAGRPGRRGRAAGACSAVSRPPTREGKLDDLEDELFRFGRVVTGRSGAARRAVEPVRARPSASGELLDRAAGRQGDRRRRCGWSPRPRCSPGDVAWMQAWRSTPSWPRSAGAARRRGARRRSPLTAEQRGRLRRRWRPPTAMTST